LNRELSLLEFNRRVLEQARDPSTPLLERLRFLTISSSNLDEFFEIRVAGLKQQIAAGFTRGGPDGVSPAEALPKISEAAQRLVTDQYRLLNELLLPALEAEGIRVPRRSLWTAKQHEWAKGYFHREVLPVLTPIGLDPAHPFPRVLNKSLNFIVTLEGKDAFGRSSGMAVVQAPRVLPRLIQLPKEVAEAPWSFILLSSVIHAHVGELFPGMDVKSCNQFRVTRNSDLWVEEEAAEDLLEALQGELFRRNYGDAVRLEVTGNSGP
jgi:polyphosphate kinase